MSRRVYISLGPVRTGRLLSMSSSQSGTSGERERSPVERLAAGVVGSDAVKQAAKRALEARERAVELQELTMGALNFRAPP